MTRMKRTRIARAPLPVRVFGAADDDEGGICTGSSCRHGRDCPMGPLPQGFPDLSDGDLVAVNLMTFVTSLTKPINLSMP